MRGSSACGKAGRALLQLWCTILAQQLKFGTILAVAAAERSRLFLLHDAGCSSFAAAT
jgi:hypothetical protein